MIHFFLFHHQHYLHRRHCHFWLHRSMSSLAHTFYWLWQSFKMFVTIYKSFTCLKNTIFSVCFLVYFWRKCLYYCHGQSVIISHSKNVYLCACFVAFKKPNCNSIANFFFTKNIENINICINKILYKHILNTLQTWWREGVPLISISVFLNN